MVSSLSLPNAISITIISEESSDPSSSSELAEELDPSYDPSKEDSSEYDIFLGYLERLLTYTSHSARVSYQNKIGLI